MTTCSGLNSIPRSLRNCVSPAPVQQRIDEAGGLVRRGRTREWRACNKDHHAAAPEGMSNAQRFGRLVKIERGLREAGNGLQMSLAGSWKRRYPETISGRFRLKVMALDCHDHG